MISSPSLGLTVSPRITASEDHLLGRTNLLVRLLTLGGWDRQMRLDRVARTIVLKRRTAWLWSEARTVSFEQVAAVTYGYEDIHPLGGFEWTHNAIDRFLTGLRLVGGEEIRLFYFVGDGAFENDSPLPDWWYWKDYALDREGTQGQESRVFTQLLCQIIGVSLVPSILTRED